MANSRSDDHSDMAEEMDINMHSKEKDSEARFRSGRGGRRGKSSGGPKQLSREVMISKGLSKLLRHAANEAGLKLDAEGYAPLDQVMKWQRLKSMNVTFEDIKIAVTDNAKQRFSMKPNPAFAITPDPASEEPSDWVIRANQGHSIAVDSSALLVPITIAAGNVPEKVVHGTYYGNYQSIVESGGLKKMGRNHIHFSTGLPEDGESVISGMRNDAELLIYIDIQRSLKDGGVSWWLSENGVVLTEGGEDGILSTKYWKRVEGRRQDVGVLWENGIEVAELPQSVRNRKAPSGKSFKGKREGEKGKGRDSAKGRGKGMKELDALGATEALGAS